jgi:hypothetical protein
MSGLLASAFVLGLLSSGHCLGMCGPLALAVPRAGTGWRGIWLGAFILSGGRLITYSLLGAAFGMFGRGLHLAGFQRGLSIAAGIIILAALLLPRLVQRSFLANGWYRLLGRLQGVLARQLGRTSPEGMLLTGMLNGLLPCGMVYLAAAGAMAQDGAALGALFMAFFGLGTWPAMVTFRALGPGLLAERRALLRRLAPMAYAIMGVLFILRGLDLGIPYISPDLPEANTMQQSCAPAH